MLWWGGAEWEWPTPRVLYAPVVHADTVTDEYANGNAIEFYVCDTVSECNTQHRCFTVDVDVSCTHVVTIGH